MKTNCLLFFLMVSLATLIQGTGYAGPSNPASQEAPGSAATTASGNTHGAKDGGPVDNGEYLKDGKSPDEQPGRRSFEKHEPRSRASLVKTVRPKQVPNNQERLTSGSAINLRQPGSARSGGAAKDGRIHNKTLNNAPPVRLQSALRPTVPSLDNVRHLGANQAGISGSAKPDGSKTGAIDGTRMIRRP